MQTTEINKLCRRYLTGTVLLTAVLLLLMTLINRFALHASIDAPLLVSSLFFIIIEVAEITVWRKIVKGNAESLTTFFTAVSGFRMLLSLFTLFICYLSVGRDAMLPYCLVFILYYFTFLAHHTIFFSRTTRMSNSKKEK